MDQQPESFINYGEGADKTQPTSPYAFIQWKGTNVCMDFHCDCGEQGGGHFDGYFAYQMKCPACGQDWEMPAYIHPRKVGPFTYPRESKMLEADDD